MPLSFNQRSVGEHLVKKVGFIDSEVRIHTTGKEPWVISHILEFGFVLYSFGDCSRKKFRSNFDAFRKNR